MTSSQTTLHRHRQKALTSRHETGFAILLAVLGFLLTAFVVLHFDDFRFAFAEWGDEVEVGEPLSE